MGERIDPVTGNIVGMSGSMGGNMTNLTPEQRQLATYHDTEADDILRALDKGTRWFTAFGIRCMKRDLDRLVDAGILTKHQSQNHDGHYYKPTMLTRPWCLTALALRDERCRLLKERTEGGQGS